MSCRAWVCTQVKNRLNKTGAKTHLCVTPFVTSNGVETSPVERTSPFMPSWKRWMRLVKLLDSQAWRIWFTVPPCWHCRRPSSGLWRLHRDPYAARCISLGPVCPKRPYRWCCSLVWIHTGLLARTPPRASWLGDWGDGQTRDTSVIATIRFATSVHFSSSSPVREGPSLPPNCCSHALVLR